MNLFTSLFGAPVPHVEPRQAHTQLAQKQAPFLLDVRQPEEYAQGHIAGAKLIPLSELRQRAHELPRDREILCVCRSGNRSGSAVRHLAAAGFKATNLSGGMIGWESAGLPVKRGSAR